MPILKDRDRRGQVYHHEAGRPEPQRKMLGGAGSVLTGQGFRKPLPRIHTHLTLSHPVLWGYTAPQLWTWVPGPRGLPSSPVAPGHLPRPTPVTSQPSLQHLRLPDCSVHTLGEFAGGRQPG